MHIIPYERQSHESCIRRGVFRVQPFNGVTEICHRLPLVAMVTKIWYSTSNIEIIVRSMAKGLNRRAVYSLSCHYYKIVHKIGYKLTAQKKQNKNAQ